MAAIDISPVADFVLENIQAVSLVGVACLGIWGAISAFRVLREMLSLGGGGGVPLSAADRMTRAREHAESLAAMGHGQSAAYAENAAVSAYDAGYMGRAFDESWGDEARERYSQAQADRSGDVAKGWK